MNNQERSKLQKALSDETTNLLLNMQGGLLPEHLQPDEVQLLIDRFGDNWFEVLGYTEPEYKNPSH